jgi:hypothetical protein
MERFIPDMKTKQTIDFLGGDKVIRVAPTATTASSASQPRRCGAVPHDAQADDKEGSDDDVGADDEDEFGGGGGGGAGHGANGAEVVEGIRPEEVTHAGENGGGDDCGE